MTSFLPRYRIPKCKYATPFSVVLHSHCSSSVSTITLLDLLSCRVDPAPNRRACQYSSSSTVGRPRTRIYLAPVIRERYFRVVELRSNLVAIVASRGGAIYIHCAVCSGRLRRPPQANVSVVLLVLGKEECWSSRAPKALSIGNSRSI